MSTKTETRKTNRLVIRCECDEHQTVMLIAVLRIVTWSVVEYARTVIRDIWLHRFTDIPDSQPSPRYVFEILLSEETLRNLKPEFVIARIQDKWHNFQVMKPRDVPDDDEPIIEMDDERKTAIKSAEPPAFTIHEQDDYSIHWSLTQLIHQRIIYWWLLVILAYDRFRGIEH